MLMILDTFVPKYGSLVLNIISKAFKHDSILFDFVFLMRFKVNCVNLTYWFLFNDLMVSTLKYFVALSNTKIKYTSFVSIVVK